MTPNAFLNGESCPKCSKRQVSKAQSIGLQGAYDRIPDSYIILDEFISVTKPNLFYCTDCGRVFKARVHDLQRFKGLCQYCTFSNKNKNDDEFKYQIQTIVGNEYSFLEPYTNARTKIKVRHNKCGHEYYVTPHNFLRGKRCPMCNESRGELYISELLKSMKIEFISQYKFSDCFNDRELPFDFYLPDYNLCIEYDGEQHYKPIEHFGGVTKFTKQQIKDNIKTNYCRKHHIKLLRIPYTTKLDNIKQLIEHTISVK